ncbi:MAG TPA: SBBP repeat-containing protein, partial [Blastocatellia bacterium]|nr:SBBP repeat-containing protein [Blastocatellia bacterium]
DQGLGITVDSAGNAYITGLTTSTDYPTTSGAYQTVTVGASNGDAFVTKLNSTGTDLIYSTYLGGQAFDQGNGIAIDSSGNAFITGTTASPDFPTTQGAFQELKDGIFTLEAFITRLNASGADLVYSTFLGGSNDDRGNDIKIDADGNAYITGSTTSQNFDVTAGAFQTMLGGGTGFNLGDAFVTKVNNTGTDLIYSTFVGAGGEEGGHRMIPSIAI